MENILSLRWILNMKLLYFKYSVDYLLVLLFLLVFNIFFLWNIYIILEFYYLEYRMDCKVVQNYVVTPIKLG